MGKEAENKTNGTVSNCVYIDYIMCVESGRL